MDGKIASIIKSKNGIGFVKYIHGKIVLICLL